MLQEAPTETSIADSLRFVKGFGGSFTDLFLRGTGSPPSPQFWGDRKKTEAAREAGHLPSDSPRIGGGGGDLRIGAGGTIFQVAGQAATML